MWLLRKCVKNVRARLFTSVTMYLHRGGYRYIYNVNRKDIKAIQLSSTFGWSRNCFVHQQNLQMSNVIGIKLSCDFLPLYIAQLYTLPSCMCIFWHVSSHYLPPIPTGLINIIGITFILNIHADIHTILCWYCTLNSTSIKLGK